MNIRPPGAARAHPRPSSVTLTHGADAAVSSRPTVVRPAPGRRKRDRPRLVSAEPIRPGGPCRTPRGPGASIRRPLGSRRARGASAPGTPAPSAPRRSSRRQAPGSSAGSAATGTVPRVAARLTLPTSTRCGRCWTGIAAPSCSRPEGAGLARGVRRRRSRDRAAERPHDRGGAGRDRVGAPLRRGASRLIAPRPPRPVARRPRIGRKLLYLLARPPCGGRPGSGR